MKFLKKRFEQRFEVKIDSNCDSNKSGYGRIFEKYIKTDSNIVSTFK